MYWLPKSKVLLEVGAKNTCVKLLNADSNSWIGNAGRIEHVTFLLSLILL